MGARRASHREVIFFPATSGPHTVSAGACFCHGRLRGLLKGSLVQLCRKPRRNLSFRERPRPSKIRECVVRWLLLSRMLLYLFQW